MKTPHIHIAGLGAHIPPIVEAKRAVELGLYDSDDYARYGWTGAAVAGDTPAPDMAIHAARQAMERAGIPSDDLDVHIHACGHEQGPVGWSAQHYILHHITDRDIPSFRVWQACSGLVGSLELAACYLVAVPQRTAALLTGSDNVNTPNFNRWAFSHRNAIVGDAASAVVLSTRGGFARLLAITTGSAAELEVHYRGDEPLFPPSTGRQIDFRERFAARGGLAEAVAEVIRRHGELLTELALRTIAEADITVADITRVAHMFTGQESYLTMILDPIGLHPEQGLLEFGRRLGHLIVNDQIIGLEHLVATGQLACGDHVLMVASGAGVSTTCAVVRIDEIPFWSRAVSS
ncbi:MAG: ketoacyl-ACP synthase III family protein [Pseudonocardiaceae bacterium]